MNKVLRLFVSVSTNINLEGERLISGRKARFVRRMVRDSVYRDADAERTLDMWQNVLRGEDKYLYPYRGLADVDFNTFHAFEPGVMRPFAERLISDELAAKSEYAGIVKKALSLAEPIDQTLVPKDSLIREFITGGIYEEFY
jgi:uridine kinase